MVEPGNFSDHPHSDDDLFDPPGLPVFANTTDDNAVAIGEFNPYEKNLEKVLDCRHAEFVRSLIDKDGYSNEEAQEIADHVRATEGHRLPWDLPAFFTEMVDLLLKNAHFEAVNEYLKSRGWAPIADTQHIKNLTGDFREALKYLRQSEPRSRRSREVTWNTWREIETAIMLHTGPRRPSAGEFALTLERFKPKVEPKTKAKLQAAKKLARDTFKHELRKLHRERLAPETEWPRLWRVVRSHEYEPRSYEDHMQMHIDVDAGDQSH